MESVSLISVYSHPGDVISLAPHPRDPTLLLTSTSDGDACLWCTNASDPEESIPTSLASSAAAPLKAVAKVPQIALSKLLWCFEYPEKVLTLGQKIVNVWDISETIKESDSIKLSASPVAGAWDPHHSNSICIAEKCRVFGWDLRSHKNTFSIDSAHKYGLRDVDYNPNKPFFLASCGGKAISIV